MPAPPAHFFRLAAFSGIGGLYNFSSWYLLRRNGKATFITQFCNCTVRGRINILGALQASERVCIGNDFAARRRSTKPPATKTLNAELNCTQPFDPRTREIWNPGAAALRTLPLKAYFEIAYQRIRSQMQLVASLLRLDTKQSNLKNDSKIRFCNKMA